MKALAQESHWVGGRWVDVKQSFPPRSEAVEGRKGEGKSEGKGGKSSEGKGGKGSEGSEGKSGKSAGKGKSDAKPTVSKPATTSAVGLGFLVYF